MQYKLNVTAASTDTPPQSGRGDLPIPAGAVWQYADMSAVYNANISTIFRAGQVREHPKSNSHSHSGTKPTRTNELAQPTSHQATHQANRPPRRPTRTRTPRPAQYLSPRPKTCAARIGTDGWSAWTFTYGQVG